MSKYLLSFTFFRFIVCRVYVMIRICMQLAEAALYHKELAVAERCYAALGDVSKARYVHKVP